MILRMPESMFLENLKLRFYNASGLGDFVGAYAPRHLVNSRTQVLRFMGEQLNVFPVE